MTTYGFGIARSVRSLQAQRASFCCCCTHHPSKLPTVDCIAFCALEETSVFDLKGFKDLLEVLREGDSVWCLSRLHVSKDAGEILKYMELITKKGATVIFANERIMCAPEEFGSYAKWMFESKKEKRRMGYE